MSDFDKPKLDPALFDKLRMPSQGDDFIYDFGRTAMGNGYIQMDMPHYRPSFYDTETRRGTEEVVAARAVIMTPGEWTQDPDAKWGMKPKDDLLARLLTVTAQSGLGIEADVQVYPYSKMQTSDGYGQGTLMVEFRDDGSTTILAESMPVRTQGEQ
jgi:hypothetical protein